MNLGRLRWFAIVLPVAFLAVFDYFRHRVFYAELHSTAGSVLFYTVVTVAVAIFSFAVFGVIRRLEREVVDRNAQLTALNEIASAAARNLELAELMEVALDRVISVMRAEAGVICLLDTESDELVAACSRGFSPEIVERIKRQKLDDDPIGARVVRTGCSVVLERLLDDPLTADVARREGFRSAVSVPLKAEGEVGGVLAVATRHERRFLPRELGLLTGIGAQLGLAVRNTVLFSRSEQRNRELAALLSVGRAAASSLELAPMLDKALDAIRTVTSAEAAEVWLQEDGGELSLERQLGEPEEAFRAHARLRRGEGLPGLAVEMDDIVAVHDLDRDARFVRDRIKRLGFATYCALPLRRGGEIVGVLGVAARDPVALCSPSELRLLEGIGEQVAVALENARLHERVLDVAVLEERERIGRELHDGLGQILGYINTQALAIRKLLDSGRIDDAEREVAAIEATARELSREAREAILGLRESLDADGGLLPALRAYLERYREMTGVAVELDADEAPTSLRLPAPVEVQLLRIVQEALNNVRKHAETATARVSMAETTSGIWIQVSDDGRGFDPERTARRGWPRFGLQTMRERAQAIGAEFQIVSQPGRGTTAIVHLPRRATRETADASLAGR